MLSSANKYQIPELNKSTNIDTNTTTKKFSVLGFLASITAIVLGAIALVKDDGAYLDSTCGNVYEWVIFYISIVFVADVVLALFHLCGVDDKSLTALCGLGFFASVLWIFINFSTKFDSTCKTLYREQYNFLYWYYLVMFYVDIVILCLGLCILCCYCGISAVASKNVSRIG